MKDASGIHARMLVFCQPTRVLGVCSLPRMCWEFIVNLSELNCNGWRYKDMSIWEIASSLKSQRKEKQKRASRLLHVLRKKEWNHISLTLLMLVLFSLCWESHIHPRDNIAKELIKEITSSRSQFGSCMWHSQS